MDFRLLRNKQKSQTLSKKNNDTNTYGRKYFKFENSEAVDSVTIRTLFVTWSVWKSFDEHVEIDPINEPRKMQHIGQKVFPHVRGKKATDGTVTYDDVADFIDTYGDDLLSCPFAFDGNFFEGFEFRRGAQGV